MPRENAATLAKLWEVRYMVASTTTSPPQSVPQSLTERKAMVGAETAKEACEKVDNTYGGSNTFKYVRSVVEYVTEILY